MRVILSEILTTEYVISTPFRALLGQVPVDVYAVLDNTVVLQIPGENSRRVVRHDLLTVEPEELRARPTPVIDQIYKSREKGRLNSRRKHEKIGADSQDSLEALFEENFDSWSEYSSLEKLAKSATEDSI